MSALSYRLAFQMVLQAFIAGKGKQPRQQLLCDLVLQLLRSSEFLLVDWIEGPIVAGGEACSRTSTLPTFFTPAGIRFAQEHRVQHLIQGLHLEVGWCLVRLLACRNRVLHLRLQFQDPRIHQRPQRTVQQQHLQLLVSSNWGAHDHLFLGWLLH